MLTEIGKELRKLRIDRGERLLDMASRINKSTSFLSAVEVGTKAPPAGLEDEIATAYDLAPDVRANLRRAADRSRRAFTVEANSATARDTAAMFARKINNLSDQQLEQINSILQGGARTDERD